MATGANQVVRSRSNATRRLAPKGQPNSLRNDSHQVVGRHVADQFRCGLSLAKNGVVHSAWSEFVETLSIIAVDVEGDVPEQVETLTMDEVEVRSYVGGLAKSFERRAA